MSKYTVRRVRNLVERAQSALEEASLDGYCHLPLFDAKAQEQFEAARESALDKLNARAKAFDALSSIKRDLVRQEIDSGLMELECERDSAQAYLKEASRLLEAFQKAEAGEVETTMPASFRSLEEASKASVRLPLLDQARAESLKDQVDVANDVLRDIEDRIEAILSTSHVVIEGEHLKALKAFHLAP